MRFLVAFALVLPLLVHAGSAAAQDLEEADELRERAVQQRRHLHLHELNLSLGFYPLDAFRKGFAVGGNYTLNFNEYISWELVNAHAVVVSFNTHLNDELDNLGTPNPFAYTFWNVTSNFVFTPFYAKFAVVNRTQLYVDFYLVGGAGYGWLTDARADVHSANHVVIDAGAGFHLFLGDHFSIRFDLRWEGFFLGLEEPHHDLWIALGFAAHVG